MALSPGSKVGPYVIAEQIGAGGMGEVYRATDTKLGRDVAIKTLPQALASDPERLARFEREAKLLASLNHAYIASIYWLDEQQGTQYLAMELVAGETLERKLRDGPLSVEESLRLALQIAEALEAAHQKGVVHRDLKPANVMVTPDGVVKVLDFGLAKAFSGDPDASSPAHSPAFSQAMTQQGLVLGTAGYMSPEQASGQATDQRADIWAFGVVLYEMLTGMPLFSGESIPHILADVLRSEPDWGRLPKDLHPRLLLMLRRCLKKKVRDRYHAIADARIDIEDVLNDPEGVKPAPESPATSPRRLVALGAATIAGFVTAAILAVVLLPSQAPPVDESTTNLQLDVVTPPTTSPASFAISPDGQYLAFVADGERGPQLWIRPLNRVAARPLDGTEDAVFPFWAPDSSEIAFFAEGQLKRTALSGGQPTVIASAPSARGGAWGVNDVILFAPETLGALMRVDARTGGTPNPVTTRASNQNSHRWPQFLPDGRRFLFQVLSGSGEPAGVYRGSLDGDAQIRIADSDTHGAYVEPGYLLVVAQSSLLAYPFDVERGTVSGEATTVAEHAGYQLNGLGAFSASKTGLLAYRSLGESPRQLGWFDRTGLELGRVGDPDAWAPTSPALEPISGRIALDRYVQNNIDIWLYDAARGLSRATDHPQLDLRPIWSADGEQVAFTSNRNGGFAVFIKSAGVSGDERPLAVTESNVFLQDWSSDDRYVLYTEETDTSSADLWALPLDGSESDAIAVAQSEYDEVQARFSPDGRWIAYASNRTGDYEIWVQPFPNPNNLRQEISTGGGRFPIWAPDGTELYYLAPDNTLMAVAVPQTALTSSSFDYRGAVPLFVTEIATTGTNIFPTGPVSVAQYAAAPDGRFLMNVDVIEAVPPINVVLDWTAAMQP